MKDIKTLGIDLAKNVFQLHGNDAQGKHVLRKRLSREKLIAFMSNLQPCLVGVEACGAAHYWARLFEPYGHTVKMMAPQFVKPYVWSNKNDQNDARGIAEAVVRPNMKFVPIKRIEQQDLLLVHRARELSVKQRTAQSNQIRGLLAEYGVIISKGVEHMNEMMAILEVNEDKLSTKAKEVFTGLYKQFKILDTQVKHYDQEIERMAKADRMCQELQKIAGVGPLIASAMVGTIGDASVFKNGREVAAWLGLVPKQHSSGNKIQLGGITKRGDRYMRKLLVQGARTIVKVCDDKTDKISRWVSDKKQRCGFNKAAVALANKNARMLWAVMATGECYRYPKELSA